MAINIYEVSQAFTRVAEQSGPLAAMRFFSSLSSHRFCGVYRFDGGMLRNVYLIDALDATVERSPDLPLLESYCMYVRAASAMFCTSNSAADPRVAGHPKQNVVHSYCGIPLFLRDGSLFGTVCLFDYSATPFADRDIALLTAIAPALVAAMTKWDDSTALLLEEA